MMPSQTDPGLSWFDRFASAASREASRAVFFALCVALVVIWAPSIWLFKSIDTWQLVINTVTTIVTFLLVALLQNSQKRSEDALQRKLNALAQGVELLLRDAEVGEREAAATELNRAVGLENHESS
jgi:low affinity Fe/Cu permease